MLLYQFLPRSILTDNCKLTNVPLVKDIFTMVKLLDFIGLKVNFIKKKYYREIQNNNKKDKNFSALQISQDNACRSISFGPTFS